VFNAGLTSGHDAALVRASSAGIHLDAEGTYGLDAGGHVALVLDSLVAFKVV
jgi:hypothetical protein